jgi:Gas vesicle synthesis protein GvpL/GvpF
MTERTLDETLLEAVQAWARQAAPGLLAGVLDDARAEATSILRRQLVDALLHEAGQLAEPAASFDRPETISGPGGSYVYGFTFAGNACCPGWRGVDGSLTSAVVEGDLAAIVSDVSGASHAWSSSSDGEPDLGALATRAREHERVLELAMEQGPVVPMRFGTLYPSPEAVRRVLRTHRAVIHGAVVQLEGKVEWGLTVTWDKPQTGEAASDDLTPPYPIEAAGRAYLSRREAEKAAAEGLARQRREAAAELHRAIEVVAVAGVVHPARRPGGADQTDVVLRASYLVDKTDADRFQKVIVAALETGSHLGLSGELTGPWPPYNFSRLELEGGRA